MKVVHYTAANGRDAVFEYLNSLRPQNRAKCEEVIQHLERYGFSLSAKHLKKITGYKKLWELRASSDVQHRIMFTIIDRDLAVLLHAFTKKTQKTPEKQIKIAVKRIKNI